MAKMTPIKDAVAAVGSYTDRQGNEKKRFVRVGTLFQYDDGGMALKIDSLPVGEGWNGFVSFFDRKDNTERGRSDSMAGSGRDLDDEIPF